MQRGRKKAVFCEECDHFAPRMHILGRETCWDASNTKMHPIFRNGARFFSTPRAKNAYNDCPYFTPVKKATKSKKWLIIAAPIAVLLVVGVVFVTVMYIL
jgi:hypothetical protein